MSDHPELEPVDELVPVEEPAKAQDPPPAPPPMMGPAPAPVYMILPPFPIKGNVHKELFLFLYGAIAVFLGALMPFNSYGEGTPGYATIPGSLALFFSILLMMAMLMSIYSRGLKLGPVVFMFVPAIWANWRMVERMIEIQGLVIDVENERELQWFEFFFKMDYHETLWGQLGTGMMFVWAGSTAVAIGFILSIVTALAGGDPKAEEKKQQRASSSSGGRGGRGRKR